MLKSQFQQITAKLPHSHRHPLHHNHHHSHRLFLSPSFNFSDAPLALRRTRQCPTVVVSASEDDGPIQLFQPTDPLFSTDDDPSPIQVATSVLLTGAISIFLFRSIRRRARRAKELQFRSTGVKKSIQEEAMDTLKALAPSTPSGESKGPPSPVQAFLGAVAAGVIALILYKFTSTVEASLNRQTISDSISVRQITVTVRTIINGLCYLVTFVFGINSIGLFLYAGQLAIKSIMEDPKGDKTPTKGEETSTAESPSNKTDDENKSSDNPQ